MSEVLKVGIAGLGTVGAGVVKLLKAQADVIALRAGKPVQVVAVSARNKNKDRGVDLSDLTWYDDPIDLTRDADVDVIVELIGGSDGPAKSLVDAAIAAGKHFVTANKALIANHGVAIAEAAEAKGVIVAYEAAVAGGIPVIKALREGLTANRLSRVYGILNGTCNYILTQMEKTGRDFNDVLKEAQDLGYAEADPTFDVDGIDTAHKLSILTSLAYGIQTNFEAVHCEGIRHVSASDIEYAAQLGYRIKLLGTARKTDNGIEQRVHPTMVPLNTPIAHVDDAINAVVAEGDFVGRTVYEGPGAGEGPTASAVVADIVDVAAGRSAAVFGIPAENLQPLSISPMSNHVGAYYVRVTVVDQPGVLADISTVYKEESVSIESLLQRGRSPGDSVSLVMVTHEVREADMARALKRVESLDAVIEEPKMIRIEQL